MAPLVSVITPASRGVKELSSLIRDFRNQTFQSFEHLIIYDGTPPPDVAALIEAHRNDYNLKFMSIEKDPGNMSMAPGTRPRNYGIEKSEGKFVVFCDDDDRYRGDYLETLITGMQENMITVVQMSCQESRIARDGNPNRIRLIPEAGLPTFPMICHVGTPCFMVPREWAVKDPWREEPEHDFRFIKRIVENNNPTIWIKYGMYVDVDGLVIRGCRDWVTIPPFYRGE